MYMMRRVHAEQNLNRKVMDVWVYQWQSPDINVLIKEAKLNLKEVNDLPVGKVWEDHSPDQSVLPGCVWNGRTDETFIHEGLGGPSQIHRITQCMIFNISKCWYSPVLSRTIMKVDEQFITLRTRSYPCFSTITEWVDYLTSPVGLGVCHDCDIRTVDPCQVG